MRRFNHLDLTYIKNRSLQLLYQKQAPSDPWLTEGMNKILFDWLKSDDVGFEWGAGRSTLWFATKVKHITAVEQNPVWADHVDKMISKNKLNHKITLEKHYSVNGVTPDSYCDVINNLPNSSLDFCLVDGDLRDRCAIQAIDKVKPGGILIIDNVERYIPRANSSSAPNALSLDGGFPSELWKDFSRRTRDWRCVWTSDGVSDTALWVRPAV